MLTRARGLEGSGGRGLCLIELLRSARGCRVALQPRCHHLSNNPLAQGGDPLYADVNHSGIYTYDLALPCSFPKVVYEYSEMNAFTP